MKIYLVRATNFFGPALRVFTVHHFQDGAAIQIHTHIDILNYTPIERPLGKVSNNVALINPIYKYLNIRHLAPIQLKICGHLCGLTGSSVGHRPIVSGYKPWYFIFHLASLGHVFFLILVLPLQPLLFSFCREKDSRNTWIPQARMPLNNAPRGCIVQNG